MSRLRGRVVDAGCGCTIERRSEPIGRRRASASRSVAPVTATALGPGHRSPIRSRPTTPSASESERICSRELPALSRHLCDVARRPTTRATTSPRTGGTRSRTASCTFVRRARPPLAAVALTRNGWPTTTRRIDSSTAIWVRWTLTVWSSRQSRNQRDVALPGRLPPAFRDEDGGAVGVNHLEPEIRKARRARSNGVRSVTYRRLSRDRDRRRAAPWGDATRRYMRAFGDTRRPSARAQRTRSGRRLLVWGGLVIRSCRCLCGATG
jgi:hypothetical protein